MVFKAGPDMDPIDDHISPNHAASNPANGSTNGTGNGAARLPGQVGMPHHRPSNPAHSADGLVQIIARRWGVIVAVTILGIFAGIGYLTVAHKIYTANAQLQVEQIDKESITSSSVNKENAPTATDFLETQCVEIKSTAVLTLALDDLRSKKIEKTLGGAAHPLDILKGKLTVEPAKVGQVINLSFEGRYPDETQQILAAVVRAYEKFETDSFSSHVKLVSDLLEHGAQDRAFKIQEERKQQAEIAANLKFTPQSDPTKNPDQLAAQSLTEARIHAESDLHDAKDAYDKAGSNVLGDPEEIKMIDDAINAKGSGSGDPAGDLKKFQAAFQSATNSRQLYLDNGYGIHHQNVETYTREIAILKVQMYVAAHQWVESAQALVDSLNNRLADAHREVFDHQHDVDEYNRLAQDTLRLQQISSDVGSHITDLNLAKGSGAINIKTYSEATLSSDTKPVWSNTIAIAAVMGLVLGLATACLLDWTDDRVRTAADIQAATGAPVLGSIPEITTATTAADRGQIVHHDPFGEASESYRTLATSIQFGLPAHTKTVLVTSPVSGDGKSTLISNLGISLAQAGKKVLIVDADFRAPMQHRLFDLKDRIGLSTVLAGGERVDRAIQRTEIQGLDVLGCGPVPANPSEILNDPAFVEYLNELADKYDLVLIDSPPVTAVADARILAVSADVSMLVVRPNKSTRKQVIASRDGLRSVGARVVGVAVNAVSKRSGFTSASGYYPRTGTLAGPARRRTPASTQDSGV